MLPRGEKFGLIRRSLVRAQVEEPHKWLIYKGKPATKTIAGFFVSWSCRLRCRQIRSYISAAHVQPENHSFSPHHQGAAASSSVYLSGGARMTNSLLMDVLAPGLLSMTMGWPRFSDSLSAMMRATRVTLPPDG